MLTEQQIAELWSTFPPPAWADWHKKYLNILTWARDASLEELRSESGQRRLWKARDITPAGPGDSVSVEAILTDPAVVEALVVLRSTTWPEQVEERAKQIQKQYESMLALLSSKGLKTKPAARLHRLFLALLPDELTCVLSHGPNRRASELLLGPSQEGMLSRQVRMRARLRVVLGEEKDLAESVQRSTFCWWLHENYDRLTSDSSTTPKLSEEPPAPPPPEPEPLEIWPFHRQFKGIFNLGNYSASYRAVVQASQPRLSMAELVEELQSSGEFDNVASKSIRQLIVRVKGLGLLEGEEHQLFPSEDGENLLTSGQSDILVERLLERVFGFAQLLRFLAQHPASSGGSIASALREQYPNWTSPRVPNDLRAWCYDLDLVRSGDGGLWSLTEYGAAWEKRLPELLTPEVSILPSAEGKETDRPPPPASPYPSFDQIRARFREDPEIASFVFDQDHLASLHAAFRSSERKRFVILSGLSGTGKTAVTLCYSRAVCELMGLPVAEHREVVPVSPDWRDPTGLLGYFNALHADPTFQAEPALRFLLRAAEDPENPYFLILDEMNLAPIERYFSPFLSAMETGKDLVLHANTAPVNGVPARIPWPRNLYIAGTVNMDESTHAISDKVLDRAFTLEFWEADLKGYFARQAADTRLPYAEDVLLELYEAVRPVRRHFGYRTAGEVLAFLRVTQETSGAQPERFLDHAVFAKVLPRLRGEDSPSFRVALEKAQAICQKHKLPRCESKASEMLASLKHTGIARFWA